MRRSLRFEDDQGGKDAGEVRSEDRVLGRQPVRIRAAGAGKAVHSPGNSLTGQESDFWWLLIEIEELVRCRKRQRSKVPYNNQRSPLHVPRPPAGFTILENGGGCRLWKGCSPIAIFSRPSSALSPRPPPFDH